MLRSKVSVSSGLAFGVALGLLTSCSDTDLSAGPRQPLRTDGLGEIGLQLQPVAGVTLSGMHYSVTKGIVVIGEGDLPTPGTANSVAFALSLPVGTGYTLSLSGTAVETTGITCTGTFGPFSVTANSSTNMTALLECIDGAYGGFNPSSRVETDACPRVSLGFVAVSPTVGTIGQTLNVFSSARELDDRPLTYAWSVDNPAAGSFSLVGAKNSTFTCAAPDSDIRLTITVKNGQCQKSLSTSFSCITAESCGNGVLDPGESCDPSLGPCPADCTLTCGDGVIEAPFEQCDPPKPGSCSSSCQVTGSCGDGVLQAGEQCDDGNGLTCDGCSPTCRFEGVPACGDGITGCGELCDPPFKENCGADCKAISKPACQTCAVNNCAGAENCSGVPDVAACNKTLDCVRDTGCADGGFALFCYCGAVSSTECDTAGGAKGACKAEIEAGLGSTDPIFIQNNLFDTTKSAGKAMARVDCELSSGCGTVCED